MEQIIEQITQDPISMIIVGILAIIIILGIVKRIFNLLIFALLSFVLYIVYLNYTGEKPPTIIEEIMDEVDVKKIQKKTKELEKDVGKTLKKAQEDLKKKIKNIE